MRTKSARKPEKCSFEEQRIPPRKQTLLPRYRLFHRFAFILAFAWKIRKCNTGKMAQYCGDRRLTFSVNFTVLFG
ncbi:unnamed protein product [Bursaphelenchus okinawaensis]|uniref:Uncharacterized protein n=1 Tax=Bursaphelenchus okinawaensis TaxID=465554 RepID=A0A811L4T7_9BILA|nr:unnamed protein product [Bursaphelenchus okinawaensis]CAG9119729.1 unnamed protein product [Bursaphelenchus okinawaensis]